MFITDQGNPGPDLASHLFDAIGRKAWGEIEELASPGIAVEVDAAPGIRTRRNEHLWRSVSLNGLDALRGYLDAIHEAMPALTVQPRAAVRAGAAPHDVIRADCSGVDHAGSPFDAETDFVLWARDGVILRLEAHVNEVAVGPEVIRHTEGDPRKYFRRFLEDA